MIYHRRRLPSQRLTVSTERHDMQTTSRSSTTARVPLRRHRLVRAFVGVGALRAVQVFAAFAVSVLLARSLGAAAFGSYTLAISLAALVALPAGAGVAPLLTREIARHEYAADWAAWRGAARRALEFCVLAGCLAAVAYTFASWWHTSEPQPFLWVALAVPALGLLKVLSGLQQGARRPVVAQLPEMVLRPVALLLVLLLLLASDSLGASAAMAAFAVSVWIALAYAALLAHRTWQRAAAGEYRYDDRRWLAALLPFTGIVAVNTLNAEAFVPLLAWLAGTVEVGLFKVALSIAVLVGTPLMVVEAVIRGDVARLYTAGDSERLRRLVRRAGWGAAALSLPVLVAIWLWGEIGLVFVFGHEFAASAEPLLVLALGFVVSNLVGPSMQLLYATDFERDALWVSIISLVVVVACALLWIPEHGALGAAWAFALGKAGRALTFKFWAEYRLRAFFAQPAAGTDV